MCMRYPGLSNRISVFGERSIRPSHQNGKMLPLQMLYRFDQNVRGEPNHLYRLSVPSRRRICFAASSTKRSPCKHVRRVRESACKIREKAASQMGAESGLRSRRRAGWLITSAADIYSIAFLHPRPSVVEKIPKPDQIRSFHII